MKKKSKIIIPIVIAVIIILAAVGTALYFFTDLFKSPKKLFYKYVGKTFESQNDYTYDEFLDKLDFYYSKACKTNTEVTLDAKLEDSDENIEEVKNLKLTLLSEVGPKQESTYSKIGLDYKNDNLTSIEYLNSNNNYGLKCSDIYKDYFYIENKNLKALAEKLGSDSDSVPDSLPKINIYDLLYISKDTRKSIYNKYYKVIDSKLDKDNFTADKGVKIDVNGKSVKADSYTLTLTATEINDILLDSFKTLKDDDETLDLFLSKYKMMAGDIKEAEISKDDLKEGLDEIIDSLEESEGSSDKIRFTVYASKGKTVKVTISADSEVIGLDITRNKKDGAISFYFETEDKKVFSVKNEYTIDGDTTKGKITLDSKEQEVGNIDYTLVDSKSKFSLEAKLNLNNSDDNVAIEFKYEVNGDNLDKKPTKYDFNGYVKISEDSNYISINFKGNTEFTDSINIPDLGTSNGVCLNTVTTEELETIKTDINANLNTFIDKILTKSNMTRYDVGMEEGTIDFFNEVEDFTSKIEEASNLKTPTTVSPVATPDLISASQINTELDPSALTF